MLETVLGIASSAGLGSIVGVVGGWLTKRENRKADAQRQAHDLALANIDLQQDRMSQDHALALADKGMESSQLEGQIAVDIAKAEGAVSIDKIEAEAFASSVAIQTKMTGILFVDGIRYLMRPVITVYLLIATTYFMYSTHDTVDGLASIPVDDLYTLYANMINQLLFLTITSVSWWFMSRGTPSVSNGK